MVENDWRYYQKLMDYWHQKAEEWLSVDCIPHFERCLQQAEKCFLLREEAAGNILVYSGRAGDRGLHYAYPGAVAQVVA